MNNSITVIEQEYERYLKDIVTANSEVSFNNLLHALHIIPYEYILAKNKSRAIDGEYMRNRFIESYGYFSQYELIMEYLDKPASVLEVLIALSMKIEDIANDPVIGDRTEQWFWEMMANIGLNGYSDKFFDENEITKKVHNFLQHEYDKDGSGNAIRIPYTSLDMRQLDLWTQVNEFIKHRM